MESIDLIKQKLGEKAASLVKKHLSLIGLGTGTTTEWFIKALAEKNTKSLCLATSDKSERLARSLGLPILPFTSWNKEEIDLLVDGADCVDPQRNMIKGLGGALLREKLVALSAKRYIILIDDRKRKAELQGKLPVEILPWGISHTIQRIESSGFTGSLRKKERNILFSTDNGNKIFDIDLPDVFLPVEEIQARLKRITGVVETGLFLHLKPELITGYEDGRIIHEVV